METSIPPVEPKNSFQEPLIASQDKTNTPEASKGITVTIKQSYLPSPQPEGHQFQTRKNNLSIQKECN